MTIRDLLLVAGAVLAPIALSGQSETTQRLGAAIGYISANKFDSAAVALDAALRGAAYQMDSVNVFVWRGIMEHQRGNDSLARASFHTALVLRPTTSVRGLDQFSPDLAGIFAEEVRAVRIYSSSDVATMAQRVSGPTLAYPPELRRRAVTGHVILRAVVDTLGRVDSETVDILDAPDSALIGPLKAMLVATTFTPARVDGKTVKSAVSLDYNVLPPHRENPTSLVTQAKDQLRARHADSALALTTAALDDVNQPTPGERVYAQLVQGLAWRAKGRDTLASAAFDSGLAGYRALTTRGVDLAPFLKRLADSVRLSRRGGSAGSGPFGAPTTSDAVDAQPAIVSHPPIRYAPEMQALRIGGTVIVVAVLDTTGRVVPATVKVLQSPNPVLDAEATRVVLATAYRPARRGGRAVQVVIHQPITFAAY